MLGGDPAGADRHGMGAYNAANSALRGHDHRDHAETNDPVASAI